MYCEVTHALWRMFLHGYWTFVYWKALKFEWVSRGKLTKNITPMCFFWEVAIKRLDECDFMWFLHISPEYITRKYTKYIYNYYMHVILSFSKNVWFKGRSWWNVNMCETWCQDGPRRLAALWPETVGLFPMIFVGPSDCAKAFFACLFVEIDSFRTTSICIYLILIPHMRRKRRWKE